MSDFNGKNKIVQANNFIQETNWALKTNQLKLFKMLVSCIDVNKPPKDNTITLYKNDIITFLKLEKNYQYLKNQMRGLQATSLKLIDTKDREIYVSLVTKIEWLKDNDMVSCKFHEDVMPYLLDLQGYFLQYDVNNLKNIKSKYALILYEYLLSRERQERNNEYTYSISVESLRDLTATTDKLLKWVNFEDRVLVKAKEEINNAGLEFLMNYDKIKVGRSIKQIKFRIRKRTSIKEIDFDIVERPEWLNEII